MVVELCAGKGDGLNYHGTRDFAGGRLNGFEKGRKDLTCKGWKGLGGEINLTKEIMKHETEEG